MKMIDITKGKDFDKITPENVLPYIQAKGIVVKNEKTTNFLLIWNKLIPYYFTAKEFCDLVNEAKQKTVEYNNFRKAVNEVFGYILSQRLKETQYITFTEVNQLIGTLFDMFRTKEEKEKVKKITNKATEAILSNQHKNEELRESFSGVLEGLQQQYFLDQGIGSSLSKNEESDFFNKAWDIFKKQNSHLPEKRLKKLYNFFLEKK